MTRVARRNTLTTLGVAVAFVALPLTVVIGAQDAATTHEHVGQTKEPGHLAGIMRARNSGGMTDMSTIHELLMSDDRIARSVTNLPAKQNAAASQQHAMPPGMTHEEHLAQMKKEAELKQHGNMAMGFDQDKATHHFTLTDTGGVIAVAANDPGDQATRDQIRAHLTEIAQAFANADFQKPVMTHSELPDGASTMQQLKDRIRYTVEQTEHGGAVRIFTSDSQALDAVHKFLRYQIREHSTGDSLSIQNNKK